MGFRLGGNSSIMATTGVATWLIEMQSILTKTPGPSNWAFGDSASSELLIVESPALPLGAS